MCSVEPTLTPCVCSVSEMLAESAGIKFSAARRFGVCAACLARRHRCISKWKLWSTMHSKPNATPVCSRSPTAPARRVPSVSATDTLIAPVGSVLRKQAQHRSTSFCTCADLHNGKYGTASDLLIMVCRHASSG